MTNDRCRNREFWKLLREKPRNLTKIVEKIAHFVMIAEKNREFWQINAEKLRISENDRRKKLLISANDRRKNREFRETIVNFDKRLWKIANFGK